VPVTPQKYQHEGIQAVVGLGYVGLPLALQFADAGAKVVGLDIDPQKTDGLTGGKSYFMRLPTERIKNHPACHHRQPIQRRGE